MDSKTAADYNLVAAGGPPHDWWGVWVDIPASATVLDFVFEDGDQHVWDNNNGADFHTAVEEPMSNDQLVQLIYEKLKAQSREDDSRQEEQRAQGSAQKLLQKVRVGFWCGQAEALHHIVESSLMLSRAVLLKNHQPRSTMLLLACPCVLNVPVFPLPGMSASHLSLAGCQLN